MPALLSSPLPFRYLARTRRSFCNYNLNAHGSIEFSCQVLPDWDAVYKDIKSDAVGRDQLLPLVKRVKFQVAVGSSGATSVSHELAQAPPTEEVAQRLRQMSGGMEQRITGFFQTWSQLMMHPPLQGTPEEYQMDETSEGYRFTADAGSIHVAITMNRDLFIQTLYAKTPELEGTVRPHFFRLQDKLVPDAYEATYKTSGGEQNMTVKIQYQRIDGYELPRTITYALSLPKGRMEEPIMLDQCQVKKR